MADTTQKNPKGKYVISVEVDTDNEDSLQKFRELITNNHEIAEGITVQGAWLQNFEPEKAVETLKQNFIEIAKQVVDTITYQDVLKK